MIELQSAAACQVLQAKITRDIPLSEEELFQYAHLTKDERPKVDPATGESRFSVVWFDADNNASGVFHAHASDGIAALNVAERSPKMPICVETTVFPGFLPESLRYQP